MTKEIDSIKDIRTRDGAWGLALKKKTLGKVKMAFTYTAVPQCNHAHSVVL